MGSIGLLSLSLFTLSGFSSITTTDYPQYDTLPIQLEQIYAEETIANKPTKEIPAPPTSYEISLGKFVSQTYNNCGPAALSMVLSTFGTEVTQKELGDQMRPYNFPDGGDDDKSVFPEEFVAYAQKYGYKSLYRPNGDLDKLKQFIANDIPVVVRTWLSPTEDISHYRIIKGYNDETQQFFQDDSYQGKDLTYSYDQVKELWQAFNYSYVIVYPSDKEAIVESILGEDVDKELAWRNALAKAKEEQKNDPQNPYIKLNQAVAYYHLKDYPKAVTVYDQAKDGLPDRILWYQLEPILAYQKVGNDNRVFEIAQGIINNGNPGYAELYQIRGEIYLKEGKKDLAKSEFEKALYYNSNYEPAQKALENI